MYSPNQDDPKPAFTPYVAGGGHPLNAPALKGDLKADIVVIGGGIAGCSLALHAAEGGSNVVLLEAKEIGWGASSRNSGHVAPATRQEPQALFDIYGDEIGQRLFEASRGGPDLVFSLIEKHGMDAQIERSGVISAAHTAAGFETLRKRTEFLKARGYDVRLLGRRQTAEVIGNDPSYYNGCSIDMHGGTLNPLAYVRGLARAAAKAGASVFERSPATGIKRDATQWRVTTAQGSILCTSIAICTNGYVSDIWPALKSSTVPVRAYQFITAPLSANVRSTILPARQGFTDMRRLMSGIRMHKDGRLHFSGQGPIFGPERRPLIETSLQRMKDVFPQLADVEIEYWWSGWMAMNGAKAWKMHELAPGVVAALGCNGRGVAIGTILGRELADYLRGKAKADLVMPFVPVKRIAGYSIHRPLVRALVAYYKLRDMLDIVIERAKNKWAAPSVRETAR